MTLLDQKYRRSNGGKTVHRAECKLATDENSLPWAYADYATAAEVALLIGRTPWLKACPRCRPTKDA